MRKTKSGQEIVPPNNQQINQKELNFSILKFEIASQLLRRKMKRKIEISYGNKLIKPIETENCIKLHIIHIFDSDLQLHHTVI